MLSENLEYCRELAGRGRNNLWRGAQYLRSDAKRDLFAVTYAAMRVIDDAVDDGFLSLPPEDRTRQRERMLADLALWEDQARAAAAGTYVDRPGALEPRVFEALNVYAGRSQIGTAPWMGLAASMRRDVCERELHRWEDFVAYAEGAAVAPAAVFVYILACEPGEGTVTTISLPRPPADYAREMAIFCYLVHILRDLAVDASRNPQLLTIPRELVAESGLDVPSFREAARKGEMRSLAPVVRFLCGQAASYGERTELRLAELKPHLTLRSRRILWVLYHWYRSRLGEVRQRYAACLKP